jgi:hypothetical protein
MLCHNQLGSDSQNATMTEVANQEPWQGLELLPQGCVPRLGFSIWILPGP